MSRALVRETARHPVHPGPYFPPHVRLVRERDGQGQVRAGGKIRDASDVVRMLADIRDEEQEHFILLTLDAQAQVIARVNVTRGLLNSSLVHPREVFRHALACGAAGIILSHNHPSGDPTPSAEDRAVTRQLVEAGRLLDVPVYDHVIIAGDRWTSFANEGML